MENFITDIEIKNFRSFGSEIEAIKELSKVNIFIGSNNAGKSNVLRAVSHYCHGTRIQISYGYEDEQHKSIRKNFIEDFNHVYNKSQGVQANPVLYRYLSENEFFEKKGDLIAKSFSKYRSQGNSRSLEDFLKSVAENHGPWIQHMPPAPAEDFVLRLKDTAKQYVRDTQWQAALRAIAETSGKYSGGGPDQWYDDCLNALNPLKDLSLKKIDYIEIPAVRQVLGSKQGVFDGCVPDPENKRSLIDLLAELSNPKPDDSYTQKKHTWSTFCNFVRTVIDDSDVSIEIPADKSTITVHKENRILPIESLGTGIHQVVMMAAIATIHSKVVIGVEEPETNLHPILQKKLLRYLHEKTTNQYFITTHSSHVINALKEASIYQVSLENRWTKIRRIESDAQSFSILESIGYSASDLLQTPCIIWVEGPSDRIFIRYWLELIDESLIEGIHYSIMFYGGRLLSHLSTDADDLKKWIALRSINRNIALVIDSDRKKSTDRINATKKRLETELSNADGRVCVWITKGREIENYLNFGTLGKLTTVLSDLKPWLTHIEQLKNSENQGLYSDVMTVQTATQKKDIDKVKLANEYVKLDSANAALDRFDLKQQIKQLVLFLQQSNAAA
jgi:AAA15 family ATPase/GTPase